MTKDEREALRESLDTMEFFDKNDIRALLDAADERDRSNARIIELLEENTAFPAEQDVNLQHVAIMELTAERDALRVERDEMAEAFKGSGMRECFVFTRPTDGHPMFRWSRFGLTCNLVGYTIEPNEVNDALRAVAEQAREALLRAHDDWTDHSWSLSADCRYRVEQALAALDEVLKEK